MLLILFLLGLIVFGVVGVIKIVAGGVLLGIILLVIALASGVGALVHNNNRP